MDPDTISSIVALLLDEIGCRIPPVPVHEIAAYLGLTIRFAYLRACPGFLWQGPKGMVIVVNRSQPLSRQRFTIAHEIAEALSWQGGQELATEATEEPLSQWELNCNEFAARLLMPDGLLRSELDTLTLAGVPRSSALRHLCDSFAVSKWAMIRRLRLETSESPAGI